MEIKLYNDIVFKWIFGRQEQTGPLIDFLNAVVSYEGSAPRFSEVQILNPFDRSEPFKNEKQGVLDIRARDTATNDWIDLEVQVLYSEDYPQRSKFYLAGMYRDQLEKNQESNYDDLRACFGIHVLVDSLFRDKAEKESWFHHFAMLDTRTHRPLLNHWHLYYIELKKFLRCFHEKSAENKLEQWSYLLGVTQDSTRPCASFTNPAIQEVIDMLQTFTKDDRLREQYRLHEEWLRVKRTEESRKQRLIEQYKKEKKAREQEKLAREQEKLAKEAALQKSAEIQRRSVLSLKKAGHSNEEISLLLDIPLVAVESIE